MSDTDKTTQPDGKATRGQMIAWASYDWANSAFPAVIQTFLFANYFTRQIAPSEEQGQTQWSLAIGLAGAMVAVTAPVLGAVADQAGRRKPWLAGFATLCIAATALMWFVTPDASVLFALTLVVIGTFGIEASVVFYNAMLPDLSPRKQLGRWSGIGWAAGYIGGLVCLVIALFGFVGIGSSDESGTVAADDGMVGIRATFLLVAGWYAVFMLPLLLFTPDRPGVDKTIGVALRDGLRQLVDTAKQIRRYRHIVIFLVARLLYIDGLASIFALGGVYASGVYDMDAQGIIMLGIGLNITAGIGAIALSPIDDKLGSKWTIALSLIALIICGAAAVLVQTELWFWVAALTLGLFVGPAQSASRSYLAHAAPAHLRTQAFGLYALSGKATAFAGPLLVFAVTAWTGSQRWGMTPIIFFLILGLIVLLTLPPADHAVEESD